MKSGLWMIIIMAKVSKLLRRWDVVIRLISYQLLRQPITMEHYMILTETQQCHEILNHTDNNRNRGPFGLNNQLVIQFLLGLRTKNGCSHQLP
jgi:hypothetical protein